MLDMKLVMKQARNLIGARLQHEGQACVVIEVLEDRLELVLESDSPSLEIQADAYGKARREMRALLYVPIINQARDGPHPYFLELLDGQGRSCT